MFRLREQAWRLQAKGLSFDGNYLGSKKAPATNANDALFEAMYSAAAQPVSKQQSVPSSESKTERTRFSGLVSVASSGAGVANIPTVGMTSARKRPNSSGREWGEGPLTATQDMLREMMEFDLDDPFNPALSEDDMAFLESVELHANLDSPGVAERLKLQRQRLPQNPFSHVKIYRTDPPGEGLNNTLSVDISAKALKDHFCDFESRKCRLCGEAYQGPWHVHAGFIPHSARESIMMEMVRPYCGTPDEVVQMWWWRLHNSNRFPRLRELSHSDPKIRRRRLYFLLKFLKDHGVIRDTFNVNQQNGQGVVASGRTFEFERLEFIGDNVIKYLFNDRINVLFPVHEGGIKGKVNYSQFMIDGNDPLARAYDYIGFNKLTESEKVISKFKSDVVETLFGELQFYLWTTEVQEGVVRRPVPYSPDMTLLRHLVSHTMEELAHVMIMLHIEAIAKALNGVIAENNIKLIRCDPNLRTNQEAVHEIASSAYSARRLSSQRRHLTPKPTPFPYVDLPLMNSQFHVGLNTKVESVGGPLPRAFARSELSQNLNFMDTLQAVPYEQALHPLPNHPVPVQSSLSLASKPLPAQPLKQEAHFMPRVDDPFDISLHT